MDPQRILFLHQTSVVLSVIGSPLGVRKWEGCQPSSQHTCGSSLFLVFSCILEGNGKGSVKGCEPDTIFDWKLDILCIYWNQRDFEQRWVNPCCWEPSLFHKYAGLNASDKWKQ